MASKDATSFIPQRRHKNRPVTTRRKESGKGPKVLLLISDDDVQIDRSWIINKVCMSLQQWALETIRETS